MWGLLLPRCDASRPRTVLDEHLEDGGHFFRVHIVPLGDTVRQTTVLESALNVIRCTITYMWVCLRERLSILILDRYL